MKDRRERSFDFICCSHRLTLIELRLTLSRAVEQTISVDEAVKQVERLEAEYLQRVDYWTAHPPFGLEAHLLGERHEAAKRLLASCRPRSPR